MIAGTIVIICILLTPLVYGYWYYYERFSGASGKVLTKYESSGAWTEECIFLGEMEGIIKSCWWANEYDLNKIKVGDYCTITSKGLHILELKCGEKQ